MTKTIIVDSMLIYGVPVSEDGTFSENTVKSIVKLIEENRAADSLYYRNFF